MKRFLFVSLAWVGVMAATPVAHATLLGPPGPNSSSTIDTTASLAGLTLVDTFAPTPLALSPPGGGVTQRIFGTYQEWVYRDAAGNLTFVEQVNLASNSTHVERVTASDYTGFTTNVSYLDPTATPPPTGVMGGVMPSNPGGSVIDRADGTVGFDFIGTPITAGSSSAVLIIATNATSYDRLGTLSVIDGTTSSNLTFEPTTATPEPSTLALAGLGAMGLIGYGLRRKDQGA